MTRFNFILSYLGLYILSMIQTTTSWVCHYTATLQHSIFLRTPQWIQIMLHFVDRSVAMDLVYCHSDSAKQEVCLGDSSKRYCCKNLQDHHHFILLNWVHLWEGIMSNIWNGDLWFAVGNFTHCEVTILKCSVDA